ncbi:unnamed protein product [Boreogadus saida]
MKVVTKHYSSEERRGKAADGRAHQPSDDDTVEHQGETRTGEARQREFSRSSRLREGADEDGQREAGNGPVPERAGNGEGEGVGEEEGQGGVGTERVGVRRSGERERWLEEGEEMEKVEELEEVEGEVEARLLGADGRWKSRLTETFVSAELPPVPEPQGETNSAEPIGKRTGTLKRKPKEAFLSSGVPPCLTLRHTLLSRVWTWADLGITTVTSVPWG